MKSLLLREIRRTDKHRAETQHLALDFDVIFPFLYPHVERGPGGAASSVHELHRSGARFTLPPGTLSEIGHFLRGLRARASELEAAQRTGRAAPQPDVAKQIHARIKRAAADRDALQRFFFLTDAPGHVPYGELNAGDDHGTEELFSEAYHLLDQTRPGRQGSNFADAMNIAALSTCRQNGVDLSLVTHTVPVQKVVQELPVGGSVEEGAEALFLLDPVQLLFALSLREAQRDDLDRLLGALDDAVEALARCTAPGGQPAASIRERIDEAADCLSRFYELQDALFDLADVVDHSVVFPSTDVPPETDWSLLRTRLRDIAGELEQALLKADQRLSGLGEVQVPAPEQLIERLQSPSLRLALRERGSAGVTVNYFNMAISDSLVWAGEGGSATGGNPAYSEPPPRPRADSAAPFVTPEWWWQVLRARLGHRPALVVFGLAALAILGVSNLQAIREWATQLLFRWLQQ